MNITIELTGIAPLAEAINNLAEALKAGTKADDHRHREDPRQETEK